MDLLGARRVLETTCPDTVNQYLRFGWKLLNHYRVEATEHAPAAVRYVLASVRNLEDTRLLTLLDDYETVNRYLAAGWRLVEKFVVPVDQVPGRRERPQFILAWQTPDPPAYPVDSPDAQSSFHRALASDLPLELTDEPPER